MRTFFLDRMLIVFAHRLGACHYRRFNARAACPLRERLQRGGTTRRPAIFRIFNRRISGPWFSQKLGKRGALLVSLFCMALGEMVFFTLPPWGIVLAIAPLAGFGFGMVETIIGAVVIGHFEESRKTVAMARIEVFFGVGAWSCLCWCRCSSPQAGGGGHFSP